MGTLGVISSASWCKHETSNMTNNRQNQSQKRKKHMDHASLTHLISPHQNDASKFTFRGSSGLAASCDEGRPAVTVDRGFKHIVGRRW